MDEHNSGDALALPLYLVIVDSLFYGRPIMKNKILKSFWVYKAIVLIFLVVGFLVGFFVTEFIFNNNFSYYKYEITSNVNPEEFLNEEFFENTLTKIDDYNNNLQEGQSKISIANIDNFDKMTEKAKIKNIEGNIYSISIQRKFFATTFRTSNGQLNEGLSRCSKYLNAILTFDDSDEFEITFNNDPIGQYVGYINPYLMGLFMMGIVLICILILFAIGSKESDVKFLNDISDNEFIFKTPFHRKYWSYASKELSTVKKLCGIAVSFALMFICKLVVIPSGFANLGIGITYLIFSIIAMIYGPICGITVGFLSDVLGYFVFQSSEVFFFGYTINAMLSGFMYGLCFYKTKITFAKCLYARLFVNLFVNVLLGSIWWSMLYDLNFEGMMTYLLFISLPKNLIYLIPQSLILFLILKAVARPLSACGILDEKIGENVTLI